VDQLVEEAKALKARHGFATHKLKGGVFAPEYELECYRAVAAALPGDHFRFDPNGVWSTEQAIWFGRQIEDIRNDSWRIRSSGCTACGARARRCGCRWPPTR
jgi:glucarate dehydratase